MFEMRFKARNYDHRRNNLESGEAGFSRIIDEARELLLKFGYSERCDARIQDAFYALVPMTKALTDRLHS